MDSPAAAETGGILRRGFKERCSRLMVRRRHASWAKNRRLVPAHLLLIERERGQWMLQVKAVRVEGEEPLPLCQDGGCWAIVDTGTSLLTVPSSVFPELFELLGTPETAEECRGPGPKLYIELEGITVTLEPSDYSMFQPAEPGQHAGQVGDANLLWQQEAEVDSCRALFMAMDLPEPLGSKIFVLGEPVLRKYYTVYETGATPRVGFGRARHAGSAEEAVVA